MIINVINRFTASTTVDMSLMVILNVYILVTMIMYKRVANNRDQFITDFTDFLIQYLDYYKEDIEQ